ncbi:A/G-specific adenine glycosylase [Thermodesulfobacteriota bacterium]
MENSIQFQDRLLRWFQGNSRDLPWRRSYSPYHIWVSEIMLQQTQMDRVVDYFNRWITRFPDIEILARASEQDVLKQWEGLGYYSRAKNIHKAARILTMQAGRLPMEHHELLKLPGIGKYTAGAIMSLAYNREYPIVDGNIERVFSRVFNIDTPVKDPESRALIWRKAEELIPTGQARFFNQALMELGALICTPRQTKCPECPVRDHCTSFKLGIVDERPVPGKSTQTIRIKMATGILIHQGRMFIQKRPEHGIWANLWEFPGGRLEKGESPEQALVREFLEETELAISGLKKIKTIQHSFTRYRVTLHCFFCTLVDTAPRPVLHEAREYRWVNPGELDRFPFPAPHRKLIEYLKLKRLLDIS